MKYALCVGINDYPGYDADLRGCVNDAEEWAALLRSRGYGVKLLLDRAASLVNITHELQQAIAQAEPGETAVFCYSGHGTWLPDADGDEPDGRDEAFVPADAFGHGRLLLDDDLAVLLERRKPGSNVLLLTDCCHAGTIHRLYGAARQPRKLRYLPPSALMLPTRELERLGTRPRTLRQARPGVVHFSACRDDEYAADAEFGGRPNGAFSRHLLDILLADADITYQDAYTALRRKLPSWDNPQTPQLNATSSLRSRVFFS